MCVRKMIRYRLFLVRVCVNMIEYFRLFFYDVRISHRVLSSLSMRNNTQQKIYENSYTLLIFLITAKQMHTHKLGPIFSVSAGPKIFLHTLRKQISF